MYNPGMKMKRKSGRKPKSESDDTRLALFRAARAEFAAKGLDGARVGAIADHAGVNKQLVYHYFGSKEDLYIAVLEAAYQDIREREGELHLAHLPPVDAMRRLIGFSFDYLDANREFVALVTDENIHLGQHLDRLKKLETINRPILNLIRETLDRGEKSGDFREGLEPIQVYLSIAGLGFFYFANNHTLSRIFACNLATDAAIRERRTHVIDFAMAAILKH